jgi:cytidylate kinase
VEKTVQDRHEFVRKHFGKDVADPHLYDLVINTSRLTVPESAELIIQALHRRESHLGAQKQVRSVPSQA